ncbi:MAG: DNA polymerase III subunit delta [Bacteroidetes bacterium]|nr:DNA polymerase III subunit delta [Bacteroidota bacterium]
MDVASILKEWSKKQFCPFYWLEGEENYFIDQLCNAAEKSILTPEESAFNCTIFYGRDTSWAEVMNQCRRYPMFAERQVVMLKEAQQLKDIEKLESYFEQPLSSTILIVAYKEKKLDNRKKMARLIKEKGRYISFKKLNEKDIASWVEQRLSKNQLIITPRALLLMVDHLGSDLCRIEQEIDKLQLNCRTGVVIDEEAIERFVGVSKDFNVFELQQAVAQKDFSKAFSIIQYFKQNPKAAPLQLVLPLLYSFFSKVYMLFGVDTADERSLAAQLGIPPFSIRNYKEAARLYGYQGTELTLLLLHQYNLKAVGVGAPATEDAALLKELVFKMTTNQGIL